MKTLVLPSEKQLVYTLGEVVETESSITIPFTASTTISDVEAIVTNDTDLLALLSDVDSTGKYNAYKVFESLSKDKIGNYRVVLQKDTVANQIATLEAEKIALQAEVVSLNATVDELIEVVIPGILDSID